LALPAGICSLMKPTTFFAMNGSYIEFKRTPEGGLLVR
jgi:hypothetical protein